MNHKERMLAGLPYKAWMDGLSQERPDSGPGGTVEMTEAKLL